MKICTTCKIEKEADCFHKRTISKDGLALICKDCDREKRKIRYENNKEDAKTKALLWKKQNPQKRKESNKKYRKLNKEEINEKRRERWGEKQRIYHRNYRKKDYVRERIANYEKNRTKTDVEFSIKRRLRSRLIWAVKKGGAKKENSTKKLLGCDFTEFKKYFESKFDGNMSWALFLAGRIHIDHIRPCSSFDLKDPEQQKQCFHYTNLQPLWAKDNLMKSDRTDWTNLHKMPLVTCKL